MEKPIVTGAADDGRYQYTSTIEEVGEDVNDRERFAKAAIEHSLPIVLKEIADRLNGVEVTVCEKSGTFSVQFKDESYMHWKWTNKKGIQLQ